MDNTCICCGEIIPEGRQVCLNCENKEEDIKRAVELYRTVCERMLTVVVPVLAKAVENIKKIWDAVLHTYPNKRVLHLAMHHPKERGRKKNMHRIMRWIEREADSGRKEADEEEGGVE